MSFEDGVTALNEANLNPVTLFRGTGAQIAALSPTYAGQLVFCTTTGSGFVAGVLYHRNAANDAWLSLSLGKKYVISDALQLSHDAETFHQNTIYTKRKTITLDTLFETPNTIRIKFDLRQQGGGATAYGRIYKNGGAVGTERSTTSGTYVTYSEDLSFADADALELWTKITDAARAVYARNFRVYGDEQEVTSIDAALQLGRAIDDPLEGTNS